MFLKGKIASGLFAVAGAALMVDGLINIDERPLSAVAETVTGAVISATAIETVKCLSHIERMENDKNVISGLMPIDPYKPKFNGFDEKDFPNPFSL